jgi:cell division protease FtsH
MSSPPPAGRRRRVVRLVLPAALVLAALATAAVFFRPKPPEALAYGQFRARLARGEVRAVRVAPAEIRGRLKDGPAERAFRTSRVGFENDPGLVDLLARHVPGADFAAGAESAVSAEAVLVPVLALAVLGALALVAWQRGGHGGALAFTRSRHRMYDPNSPRITFEDVAGIDEALVELREVVSYLKDPQSVRVLGGRMPRGLLLVGPPGTGKTLLARAVAGEAGVPFFSLSGSDFLEMYVGVGAARVRNLFSQAERAAPCVVFIDEIDAIGKARSAGGTGSNEERDQTLNQLLVGMDGFDGNRGVVVLAATNRPETLDPALVRPGRFDRNVTVDRPDLAGRERILQVHVRRVRLDDHVDLRQIAAMTSGFAGADLANLVNEAALLAARKGKPAVDAAEFEEGVERLLAGPARRQRLVREADRRRTAVHEAGHALVSMSLPDTDPVHKVTIVGRGSGALGYTLYRPEEERFLHTATWIKDHICTLLGGTVAEDVILGEPSSGATSDLRRATELARKMVAEFGMSPRLGRVSYQSDGRSPFLAGATEPSAGAWSPETAREIDLEIRALLDDCLARTRQILVARRPALEAMTARLLDQETIDAAEAKAILAAHPAG